jgi:hypothetical protein
MSCFFIRYDVETPDPSVEFSVSLKGLSTDGEVMQAPEWQFKEGVRGVFFLLM